MQFKMSVSEIMALETLTQAERTARDLATELNRYEATVEEEDFGKACKLADLLAWALALRDEHTCAEHRPEWSSYDGRTRKRLRPDPAAQRAGGQMGHALGLFDDCESEDQEQRKRDLESELGNARAKDKDFLDTLDRDMVLEELSSGKTLRDVAKAIGYTSCASEEARGRHLGKSSYLEAHVLHAWLLRAANRDLHAAYRASRAKAAKEGREHK